MLGNVNVYTQDLETLAWTESMSEIGVQVFMLSLPAFWSMWISDCETYTSMYCDTMEPFRKITGSDIGTGSWIGTESLIGAGNKWLYI